MDFKSLVIGFLLATVLFMIFRPRYSFYTSPDFANMDLSAAMELYKKTLEDVSIEFKTKIDSIKDDDNAKTQATTEMNNFIEELNNKYNSFMVQNAPTS
jgi:hypothetical protein